jgi:hypothetical protein
MYWIARVALFFAALLAEWALGWRHWTAVLGAIFLDWFVTYAMFGSIHDIPSRHVERALTQRAARKGTRGPSPTEPMTRRR